MREIQVKLMYEKTTTTTKWMLTHKRLHLKTGTGENNVNNNKVRTIYVNDTSASNMDKKSPRKARIQHKNKKSNKKTKMTIKSGMSKKSPKNQKSKNEHFEGRS